MGVLGDPKSKNTSHDRLIVNSIYEGGIYHDVYIYVIVMVIQKMEII